MAAAGVVASLGAGWGWLHTRGGEAWLRSKVLTAAGEAIQGRVELDALALENPS